MSNYGKRYNPNKIQQGIYDRKQRELLRSRKKRETKSLSKRTTKQYKTTKVSPVEGLLILVFIIVVLVIELV